jgi:sarcosine oxidase subunit gamma
VPERDDGLVDDAVLTLAECPLALAFNVRGDPAHPAFVAAAGDVLGLPLPLQPNTSVRNGGDASLWLGPKSWLFIGAARPAGSDFDAARRALNAAGGALFDVSASYVGWSVCGAAAGRALSRACPLDFHRAAFPAGCCAQSLLGHIGALFYRPAEAPAFVVLVARSFADDARHVLFASAATDGYKTAPPASFDRDPAA